MGNRRKKSLCVSFFLFPLIFSERNPGKVNVQRSLKALDFGQIQLHTNSVNYILETRSRSNSLHLRNGCVQKEQSVEILVVVLTLEFLHYTVKLIVVKWLAIFAAFLLQYYFAE